MGVPGGVVCVGGLRCLPVDTVVVLLSFRFSPSGGRECSRTTRCSLEVTKSPPPPPTTCSHMSRGHTVGRVRSLVVPAEREVRGATDRGHSDQKTLPCGPREEVSVGRGQCSTTVCFLLSAFWQTKGTLHPNVQNQRHSKRKAPHGT